MTRPGIGGRLAVALGVLLQVAACATAGSAGLRPIGASGDAREGLDAWLLRGDQAAAGRALRVAVDGDPRDPWAHLGLAMLARRSLDASAELAHLLEVVRAAPGEAVGLVAVERLAELARIGPEVDRAIEEGLAPLAISGRLQGVVAFRARVARIAAAEVSGNVAAVAQLRQEYGVVTEWTVVGPVSPVPTLDFDADLGPDLPAQAPAVPGGPPNPARRIPTPDGLLAIAGEEASGLHLLASDAHLARGGSYLLMLWTRGSARVQLDGAIVAERRAFAGFPPATQLFELELSEGRHRLVVRFAPDADPGAIAVGLARADGAPSDATWTAPAPGALPAPAVAAAPARPFSPRQLASALEVGGGKVAGRLLAARAILRLDREGAKALLAEAAELAPRAAPVHATLADALSDDPTLDAQVGRARGEAELRRALEQDPGDAETRLALSALLRTSDRAADAESALADLPAAAVERPAALVERAAVSVARGAPERADALAAMAAAAGSCDARLQLYESAQAREVVAQVDALARALVVCRNGRERLIRHLEKRGDWAAALEVAAPLARMRPADLDVGLARAGLLASSGDVAAAQRELDGLAALWPTSARLWKRIGALRELAGERSGARAARERALSIDGADLELRRALALEEGREPLDDLREDGPTAIQAYEGARGPRDTSTALVLDAAAEEFHPGGAVTDRIHQIIHVLDQRGVERYGEMALPPGAQILTLRTRKPDGRTFEPDGGEGKGSISLSGLEPGDYVEVEYLRSSRGALDGHAADPFFFQDVGERLERSTYAVVAPADLGLAVDAHGMEPPPLARDGDRLTLRVLRTDVPGLVAEPGAPRAPETLPWVQVGYGADRTVLHRRMAEAAAPRTRVTLEIATLAKSIREAAGEGADAEALARAAWAVVAARVSGSRGSLVDDASEVLSRGRGSRATLMKALLGALGIEAHIALARPFDADPRPYRFPRHALYRETLLRIRLPGRDLWIDPDQRDAPFGSLPSDALDAEALILPAPGEPLEIARTPAAATVPSGRRSAVRIVLEADGSASVEGTDTYRGSSAGFVRGALEQFDAAARRRIFEQSVAGTFRGGTLEDLELEGMADREAELTIAYRARVPAFARRDGDGLVVEAPILPARLRESFVRMAARKLPLLVTSQDPIVQRIELVTPSTLAAVAAPDLRLEERWGRYERRERIEGGALVREETIALARGRIAPSDYPDFARFVMSIDAAEDAPIRLDARAARGP